MLAFINKLLDSQTVRRIAVFLGLISVGLRFFATLIPNPDLLIVVTTIALCIIGVYIGIIVFQVLWLKEQRHYLYQAKRYGTGYSKFEVQCFISEDGSAIVLREVKIEAFSILEGIDTFYNIPEEDPDGESRYIEPIKIEAKDEEHQVILTDVKKEPGRMLATINFAPFLRNREKLQYTITERLPVGLYAIDLSQEELDKRETPYDYYGWHVNRPTKKLIIRVYFPRDFQPSIFGEEVRYAASAGVTSQREQHEERKRLKGVVRTKEGDRYVLNFEINYPLSGLVYILRWSPLTNDS